MRDDELMDRLLTDAMATKVPQLSPAFDARVMQQVRPRRLSPKGRVVMAVYVVVAVATVVLVMQDLPLVTIAAGGAIGLAVAASASAYVRRLALGS